MVMDAIIPNIKPLALEPWLVSEQSVKEPASVKPIAKGEEASFRKLRKESTSSQRDASSTLDSGKTNNLAQQIQSYLSEFHVNLNFEVSNETGQVVVKVINTDTKEVIRQIPPEDLLKVRDKLEELRGVLFASKA
jgi:flagellar protein FlaG